MSSNSTPASADAEFPTWVRNWLHYDTLAGGLYKQALNARKVREDYEQRILGSLTRRGLTNAILQLKQGKFQSVEESHQVPMSYANIEALLHLYFKVKGAGARDETGDIMAFFKQHRKTTHTIRLRRIDDPAEKLPAPQALLE
jgi:hypothetical protein